MQAEILGNIPRLYTALADWLACLLYLCISYCHYARLAVFGLLGFSIAA